jgi:hypothetical protein
MADSIYKDRIQKSRHEQAERQKAIARDAAPYDKNSLYARMPWGCGFLTCAAVAAAIVFGVWFLVKFARGG